MVIGILSIILLAIILEVAFRGKKKTAEKPKPSSKVIPEPKIPSKVAVEQKCPYCGGELSELSFYKLKSGNDVKCEYCGAMISGR